MLFLTKIKPWSILVTLTILLIPATVSASEGSRLKGCLDNQDEAQRNSCITQLEESANTACANDTDKKTCKENYMLGGGMLVDEEPKHARNTCKTWDDCPLVSGYITPAINALSGAVGIVVVTMIVWGGIRYTSSRDNPQQAASAKEHIRNALFALVIYIFMIAFLDWVVPGGVF